MEADIVLNFRFDISQAAMLAQKMTGPERYVHQSMHCPKHIIKPAAPTRC